MTPIPVDVDTSRNDGSYVEKSVEATGTHHASQTKKFQAKVIRECSGFENGVTSLKFTRNGDRLCCASTDNQVGVVDLLSSRIIAKFSGHKQGISDVVWSEDSNYMCSASDDTTLRIWGVRSGKCLNVLRGHTNYVFCTQFHPHSAFIVSGSYDETIRVWDMRMGRCLSTINAHSDPITALDFSHDGTVLLSSSLDGLCRIWDVPTWQSLLTMVDEDCTPASFARFVPNSKYVVASHLDGSIRMYQVLSQRDSGKTCRVKKYTGHKNQKYCCVSAFVGRKHSWLASGSEDHKIYLWDVQTEEVAGTLDGHKGCVLGLSHHPSRNLLASGALERNSVIKIWEYQDPV